MKFKVFKEDYQIHGLKSEYYDKDLFIKEFIKFCRECKNKLHSSSTPNFINKFVYVNGESWKFEIYITKDGISTKAEVYKDGKVTEYPKTKWGAPYSRWDDELLKFLKREVNKQD